jgi:hypothetical protein
LPTSGPGGGSPPGLGTHAACPASAITQAKCLATLRYHQALLACQRSHGKKLTACRKRALLAYHRGHRRDQLPVGAKRQAAHTLPSART